MCFSVVAISPAVSFPGGLRRCTLAGSAATTDFAARGEPPPVLVLEKMIEQSMMKQTPDRNSPTTRLAGPAAPAQRRPNLKEVGCAALYRGRERDFDDGQRERERLATYRIQSHTAHPNPATY